MTHNNNGQEWWLQEVDMDGRLLHTSLVGSDLFLCWQRRVGENKSFWGNCSLVIPSGTWSIHSDSQTITEEQAAEIVEKPKFNNYPFFNATSSYNSLLRSLGLEGKRIINLKKIKQ